MFRAILDIILFTTFITAFWMGIKSFFIRFSIRARYKNLIGVNWNGRVNNKQLKKLKAASTDELLISEIDKAVYFQKIVLMVWIIGLSIFIALIVLNGFFRWG